MSVHHRIDYFELPTSDIADAKRFYSPAFDWQFNDYGPGYAVCLPGR
jgi:predicted enzyme related to lactoylglutathione lyase